MEFQSIAVLHVQLAYVAIGTVFLFFRFACRAIAAIRKRGGVRILVWLGLCSGCAGPACC